MLRHLPIPTSGGMEDRSNTVVNLGIPQMTLDVSIVFSTCGGTQVKHLWINKLEAMSIHWVINLLRNVLSPCVHPGECISAFLLILLLAIRRFVRPQNYHC